MKKRFLLILKISISLFLMVPLLAQDMRIVCPYVGSITDVYKNDERKLDLKDNSLLKGVFFQWVSPDSYQWNVFIYQSSNINYSTIWGGHFIFDYYFPAGEQSKLVIGCGIEYLRINMDADSSIYPLKNLEILNNVYIPYLRCGYRFEFNNKNFNSTIMPWIGIEFEQVKGNMTMAIDPPGPAPLTVTKININDHLTLGMAGINFNSNLFHVLDIELKYYGAFDNKSYFSTANAMLNVFLTHHWGVSYRAKYMEIDKGSDLYHIFGIVFVF